MKIQTEILQRINPVTAWEYKIIPYEAEGNVLVCYGAEDGDWTSKLPEIEVITGEDIRINLLQKAEVIKLLNQYYRKNSKSNSSKSLISDSDGFLMRLIAEAFSNYASDIHFECYEERCRIRFRMDGQLIERYVIEKNNYPSIVNQTKIMANLDISEKRLPQDGRIYYQSDNDKFDVRVSCIPTIYGEKIVLRLLTRHVDLLDLSNLGFSQKQLEDYIKSVQKPHGLVLISGPTGSGKSTTLYATLRMLNKEISNILTIEDPVEYTIGGINQMQLKEEIGLTFGSALRAFLRQDPDIIMLGEIRDTDTAQMAIRSALTGHLLLSTIHTNSAWGSISRLIDMNIHPYLISNTLVLTVAQRLVRLLCPHCKKKIVAGDEPAKIDLPELDCYYQPVGCEECYYTGYKGRKAIYEVIPIDGSLTEAIRNSRNNIDDELRERGIATLKESGYKLFVDGATSMEEIIPIIQ
jgi:general secretion pathway protein E/type IV pilus assembly protein PilB